MNYAYGASHNVSEVHTGVTEGPEQEACTFPKMIEALVSGGEVFVQWKYAARLLRSRGTISNLHPSMRDPRAKHLLAMCVMQNHSLSCSAAQRQKGNLHILS